MPFWLWLSPLSLVKPWFVASSGLGHGVVEPHLVAASVVDYVRRKEEDGASVYI